MADVISMGIAIGASAYAFVKLTALEERIVRVEKKTAATSHPRAPLRAPHPTVSRPPPDPQPYDSSDTDDDGDDDDAERNDNDSEDDEETPPPEDIVVHSQPPPSPAPPRNRRSTRGSES